MRDVRLEEPRLARRVLVVRAVAALDVRRRVELESSRGRCAAANRGRGDRDRAGTGSLAWAKALLEAELLVALPQLARLVRHIIRVFWCKRCPKMEIFIEKLLYWLNAWGWVCVVKSTRVF